MTEVENWNWKMNDLYAEELKENISAVITNQLRVNYVTVYSSVGFC